MIRYIKGVILAIASIVLCVVVAKYCKGYYDEYQEEYKGTYSYQGEDVVVTIPDGASAKEIAKILKKSGLIKFESAFTRRLKDSQYRGKLKAGTYTLNTGMNTLQMMEAMCPVIEVDTPIDKLVVPEGFSVDMIAARCEEQGICTKQEFLNECQSVTSSDFSFLADVPAGADVKYKVEGYLFPATYDIYSNTTAKSLVHDMLTAFDNYYSQALRDLAAEKEYSSYDVLVRASIVEREARVEDERAIIAGVIENRLAEEMNLQMCPTVLYPLTDGMYDQEQVLYEDLEIESPYNTYKYTGLPVGPICNPGLDCIRAVLNPEEHNYLYYHTNPDEEGRHIFTETYEEHVDTQIIGGPNSEESDSENSDSEENDSEDEEN